MRIQLFQAPGYSPATKPLQTKPVYMVIIATPELQHLNLYCRY